jgi:hypothetical protein
MNRRRKYNAIVHNFDQNQQERSNLFNELDNFELKHVVPKKFRDHKYYTKTASYGALSHHPRLVAAQKEDLHVDKVE